MGNWIEQFRALGLSLLEVFRAEWEALRGDFARSGRHFGVALALLGAVAVLAFWALGALVFALGAVLAIWLPVWAAALIVAGLFLLVAAVLALLARGQLRQAENPARSVRRRLDDHLAWWHESLLREEEPIEVAPAGAGAGRPGGPEAPRRFDPALDPTLGPKRGDE